MSLDAPVRKINLFWGSSVKSGWRLWQPQLNIPTKKRAPNPLRSFILFNQVSIFWSVSRNDHTHKFCPFTVTTKKCMMWWENVLFLFYYLVWECVRLSHRVFRVCFCSSRPFAWCWIVHIWPKSTPPAFLWGALKTRFKVSRSSTGQEGLQHLHANMSACSTLVTRHLREWLGASSVQPVRMRAAHVHTQRRQEHLLSLTSWRNEEP